MNKHTIPATAALTLALFGGSVAEPLDAQLASASASFLGTGGNGTATARGFGAIAVNPAGLGMPGAGFSLALIPIQVRTGLDPIGLGDLAEFEGILVPGSTKEAWLADVGRAGGQTGSLGADVTGLSLSLGRVGLQLSTLASSSMNLAPDIVELMLYGNAGRTGIPTDLSLGGSLLDAFAVSTAGASVGLPLPSTTADMALGVTFKYSVGHVVAAGRDEGGTLQGDPVRIDLRFPIASFDDEDDPVNNGTGFGVDVGFQMERDRLSVGATVMNVVNTFAWDADKLVFRPGTALLEQGENATDFDSRPLAGAPAMLQDAIEALTFDPVVSVGAAFDVSPDFTVSSDVRRRFGSGMDTGPKFHAGAGAEYRGLGVLHLRGGAAVITDGVQFGGGASLVLGPVNLSAAAAVRRGDLFDTTLGQFTLSFGGR